MPEKVEYEGRADGKWENAQRTRKWSAEWLRSKTKEDEHLQKRNSLQHKSVVRTKRKLDRIRLGRKDRWWTSATLWRKKMLLLQGELRLRFD